jgi:hypothetical protein
MGASEESAEIAETLLDKAHHQQNWSTLLSQLVDPDKSEMLACPSLAFLEMLLRFQSTFMPPNSMIFGEIGAVRRSST